MRRAATNQTRHAAGAGCALLAAILAGCTHASERSEPRHNVVLITIDTLRADHCSFSGYERATTPFLDELAGRSTVFENAYANSSWTAPSMASLFTSLPPRSHGVIAGFTFDGKVVNQDYLSDEFDTLAEVLSRHGYETFAVSTNPHLSMATGFAQGFDAFEELWWEPSPAANARVLRLRERLSETKRYFLWAHYIDPHHPYEPREPWVSTYRRLPPGQAPEDADLAKLYRELVDLGDRYDSEINYVDASLRDLFTELALESNSLVIVTADHGEGFFDHGMVGHGKSLFEEEIRVPLIVRLPGQAEPRRVAAPVSLVDLHPTIVDILHIEPPAGLAGLSVLPAVRGEAAPERAIVTELDRGKLRERTLRWRQWKLYRHEAPNAAVRLFDLRRDPREQHDLSATDPEPLRDLERRYADWGEGKPRTTAPRKVAPFGQSEAERERLRALGYL